MGGLRKTLYSAEYDELVRLLRLLRREAGLAQVQVAARLARPQSFVSKYESGQRRLDVVELRTVCRTLGWDVVAFIARWEATLRAAGSEEVRPGPNRG